MEGVGIRTIKDVFVEVLYAPPADKRFGEFVLISNGLEVIRVSLRVVILGFERLTTLTLSARVVTNPM